MSLTVEQLRAFQLARYEFRLRATENALLPTFLGAILRGSFGHALKTTCCSVKHQHYNRCLLTESYTYPQTFKPSALPENHETRKQQDPPRPFLFQPPLSRVTDSTSTIENNKRAWCEKHIPVEAGDSFSFGITLFGKAIENLPYIVYAVELMAHHGLGFARTPFELEEVLIVNERNERTRIYKPEMTGIAPHKAAIKTLSSLVGYRLSQLDVQNFLTLFFITPTWIEIKKETLESINCEQFIKRLSWRVA